MAKRTKMVFNTHEIAHLWAHAAQLSARNPQGNFSFAGRELRSYSTTIAERITHKGKTVFLMLDNTWSSTTNVHQSLMRQAAHGDYQFTVKELPPQQYPSGADKQWVKDRRQIIVATHKRNVAAMMKHAEDLSAKSLRARTNAAWLSKEALSWYTQAQRYVECFKVRVKLPEWDMTAIAQAALERHKNASAAQRKANAERKKREEQAAAKLNAMMPKAIEYWRAVGSSYHDRQENIYISPHDLTVYAGGHLMRIDGDEVVTNIGARVPAPIVRRMVRGLLNAMDSENQENRFAVLGKHVGPYAITEIATGHVRIGCHMFQRSEIVLIAEALERAEIVPAAQA